MSEQPDDEFSLLERILSSSVMMKNLKILFLAWIFTTSIIFFVIEVNYYEEPNIYQELAYEIIFLMLIFFVLFVFGQKKYKQNFSRFRYTIREKLRDTEFDERTHIVLAYLVPHLKSKFFKRYILFSLLFCTIYLQFFILSSPTTWIILFVGLISLYLYNRILLLIDAQNIISTSNLL